jgi:hypothetical protein
MSKLEPKKKLKKHHVSKKKQLQADLMERITELSSRLHMSTGLANWFITSSETAARINEAMRDFHTNTDPIDVELTYYLCSLLQPPLIQRGEPSVEDNTVILDGTAYPRRTVEHITTNVTITGGTFYLD